MGQPAQGLLQSAEACAAPPAPVAVSASTIVPVVKTQFAEDAVREK
jgi:hypothetical protein